MITGTIGRPFEISEDIYEIYLFENAGSLRNWVGPAGSTYNLPEIPKIKRVVCSAEVAKQLKRDQQVRIDESYDANKVPFKVLTNIQNIDIIKESPRER